MWYKDGSKMAEEAGIGIHGPVAYMLQKLIIILSTLISEDFVHRKTDLFFLKNIRDYINHIFESISSFMFSFILTLYYLQGYNTISILRR